MDMMYISQFIGFLMFAFMCLGSLAVIALLLEWAYKDENNKSIKNENDNSHNDAYALMNIHGKER